MWQPDRFGIWVAVGATRLASPGLSGEQSAGLGRSSDYGAGPQWPVGSQEYMIMSFRSRPSGRSGAELPARARRPAGLSLGSRAIRSWPYPAKPGYWASGPAKRFGSPAVPAAGAGSTPRPRGRGGPVDAVHAPQPRAAGHQVPARFTEQPGMHLPSIGCARTTWRRRSSSMVRAAIPQPRPSGWPAPRDRAGGHRRPAPRPVHGAWPGPGLRAWCCH